MPCSTLNLTPSLPAASIISLFDANGLEQLTIDVPEVDGVEGFNGPEMAEQLLSSKKGHG